MVHSPTADLRSATVRGGVFAPNVWRTAIFIASLWCLNALLVAFYTDRVMADSLLNRQDHQFAERTSSLDYLVIGDSHMQEDVRPHLLGRAFNYASSGENYVNSYYKLANLVSNGRRQFDTVLVQVDLSSFSDYQGSEFAHPYYWQRYLPYVEILLDGTGEPGKLATARRLYSAYYRAAKIRFAAVLVPYLGESQQFWRYFMSDQQRSALEEGFTIRPSGYASLTADQRRSQAEARVTFQIQGYTVPDPKLVRYFTRILDLCRVHGIPVILILTPRTDEYRAEVERQVSPATRARYEQLLATLRDRYPEVVMLDHRAMFAGRDDVFGDSDHLSATGATEYTPMLVSAVRSRQQAASSNANGVDAR